MKQTNRGYVELEFGGEANVVPLDLAEVWESWHGLCESDLDLNWQSAIFCEGGAKVFKSFHLTVHQDVCADVCGTVDQYLALFDAHLHPVCACLIDKLVSSWLLLPIKSVIGKAQVGDRSASYWDGGVELQEGLSHDIFEEAVEHYRRKHAALAESHCGWEKVSNLTVEECKEWLSVFFQVVIACACIVGDSGLCGCGATANVNCRSAITSLWVYTSLCFGGVTTH